MPPATLSAAEKWRSGRKQPLLRGCQLSLCYEPMRDFLTAHDSGLKKTAFEPQETESRAELVGAFPGHLNELVSDWLGTQMQNSVSCSRIFHRFTRQNVPLLRSLRRINGAESFGSLTANPVASPLP